MIQSRRTGARALLSAAVLVSSFMFMPALQAATEMPTGGPPAQYIDFLKMKAVDVMHMMDKGNKGKVSREEFMKFHEEMFNKMDKNKDGFLSAEEFGLSSP